MYSGGGIRMHSVARAGGIGVCAMYCVGAGCVFTLPGFIMTIVAFGDSTWEDSFFNSMRVIAMILLVSGLLLLAVGIGLCVYVKKTMSTETQGTVVSQGPAVTGYNPGVGPQGGYPMGSQPPPNYNTAPQYQQPGQQYPPQGQYPPPGQQYPPAGQQYPPPGQQYPPPGQQYPPMGQQYPPQDSYAPPHYPSGEANAPSAPPAYNTVVDSKQPYQ